MFGLDASLNLLVNAFKSAAQGYGIEKRVLLLHGPVGSSKSTIARLLKKGLERYQRQRRRGACTRWAGRSRATQWCPMNEEPLHLVPERFRDDVAANLNAGSIGRRGEQVKNRSANSAPSAATSTPTCARNTPATGPAWSTTCASSG